MVVLGAAAYYYFQVYLPSKQQVSTDLTKDWNTYKNDDFGFSIKYPKDWFLEKYDDFVLDDVVSQRTYLGALAGFGNFEPPLRRMQLPSISSCLADLFVGITDEKTIEDWLAKPNRTFLGLSPSSREEISVNSVIGVKDVYLPNGKQATETKGAAYFLHDRTVIAFYSSIENEVCASSFDQIVSTLVTTD